MTPALKRINVVLPARRNAMPEPLKDVKITVYNYMIYPACTCVSSTKVGKTDTKVKKKKKKRIN